MIILHKALEAAQQEKRASSAYLAAAEDKDRLELVRHKVRQIAELTQRVETLEQDRERLVHEAGLLEQQVQELQQHVQLLMDKNQAKQQVICKLSQKLTEDLAQPEQPADGDFLSQQERIEHLKVGPLSAQHALLASGCHQWISSWGRSPPHAGASKPELGSKRKILFPLSVFESPLQFDFPCCAGRASEKRAGAQLISLEPKKLTSLEPGLHSPLQCCSAASRIPKVPSVWSHSTGCG